MSIFTELLRQRIEEGSQRTHYFSWETPPKPSKPSQFSTMRRDPMGEVKARIVFRDPSAFRAGREDAIVLAQDAGGTLEHSADRKSLLFTFTNLNRARGYCRSVKSLVEGVSQTNLSYRIQGGHAVELPTTVVNMRDIERAARSLGLDVDTERMVDEGSERRHFFSWEKESPIKVSRARSRRVSDEQANRWLLDKLKRLAIRACRQRHHYMGHWQDSRSHSMGHLASISSCTECGKEAVINTHPAPNETTIAGEAVALDCTINEGSERKHFFSWEANEDVRVRLRYRPGAPAKFRELMDAVAESAYDGEVKGIVGTAVFYLFTMENALEFIDYAKKSKWVRGVVII
ncbi:MAG: hypothetical protein ACXABY_00880 [Candidatus Thorarchaeota archaeon]|jgi:hypothetical protein